MAAHYQSARDALRTIAGDEWTYSEDAAYASEALAKAGLESEACALLTSLSRKANAYCGNRILAVQLLIEIHAKVEARACADELASEWAKKPPDMDLSWMSLAEAFHKLGRRQAATGILNRLDCQLSGELELSFLAQTYLTIGKPRKAKAAARRAFDTMEWSRDLQRGLEYSASQLADLLDRVGAGREAAFVRKDLKRLEDQASDALRTAAVDRRRIAKERLGSALELLDRHDSFGVTALEALLNDPGAPRYERFSAVPHLLASSARRARGSRR
jgi:predicted Zn-dependent protease